MSLGIKKQLLNKVPQATIVFWITKILTTGMGETTSDYFAHKFDPIAVVIVAGITLLAALCLQFYVRRYIPWVYWLAVVIVSVFGTIAADVLHVGLGVPYSVSTASFAITLAIIFVVWYAYEKTLSIHSIYTVRRELFYWAVVLTTFSLGTAAGDMTASSLGLGYLASGILFAIVISLPAVAHWKFRLNGIFAFWFAYIMTRPVGASFADWIGVTHVRGGLGFGTGSISLVLFAFIVCFVGYLSVSHNSSSPEK